MKRDAGEGSLTLLCKLSDDPSTFAFVDPVISCSIIRTIRLMEAPRYAVSLSLHLPSPFLHHIQLSYSLLQER
jgi:hypothetical protein